MSAELAAMSRDRRQCLETFSESLGISGKVPGHPRKVCRRWQKSADNAAKSGDVLSASRDQRQNLWTSSVRLLTSAEIRRPRDDVWRHSRRVRGSGTKSRDILGKSADNATACGDSLSKSGDRRRCCGNLRQRPEICRDVRRRCRDVWGSIVMPAGEELAWWRWWESNPRPRNASQERLRA